MDCRWSRILSQNKPINDYLQRWSHLKDIDFPQFAIKVLEILIGKDSPKAYWMQEKRLFILGYIRPLDRQRNSDVKGTLTAKRNDGITSVLVFRHSLENRSI